MATDIDGACTIELSQGEMETPHMPEALEHRLADTIGPYVYAVAVGDTDVKVQASDSKVLLVLRAGSREALKNIVAVDSECVGGVVDHIRLQINLTAGPE